MTVGLPDPEKSRVVLIGVADYAELDALPAVENNLRRLRELLTDPGLWGIPEGNCTTIMGDDDPRTVPREIRAAARSAEDLLLVYYAGHGLLPPDNDKFCLALPSSSKDYTDSALRYEDVRGAVTYARPGTGRAVILDCCFSARAFEGGMTAPQSLGELARIPGTCMLTASDETTQALAPPGETYTAFTGELIAAIEDGIEGAPELLDAGTLYRHLCAMLAAKSRPQPQFLSRGEGRELCLVRNRRFVRPSARGVSPRSTTSSRLPDGIRSLAYAQVRAADDFPYRLVGARRSSLSAVYVRQDVSEARQERERSAVPAAPESDPAARGSRPAATVSSIPRTVDEALRLHRHIVIIGGPGQGKSTLTLQLTCQLAHDLLHQAGSEPPALLPVRVTAPALAARSGPLFQRIRTAAAAELGLHLDSELPEQLLQGTSGQRDWLVVIDGLDEITDPGQRGALIGQLAARTRDAEDGLRLLITTRPLLDAELEPLRGIAVGQYQLEPFSRERLQDFACRWFGDHEHESSQASEFLYQVRQAGPSELVRVPLLATIAAIVYERRPTTAMPGSRYMLYQSYLSYLQTARAEATSDQWRRIRNRIRSVPGGDTRPLDYLRGHLPQLVTHLAEAAVSGIADLGQSALEWIEQHAGRSRVVAPEWAGLVAGLLDSTGLFVHTASGQRFIHHSFAEHLAGQAVSDRLPTDFDPTAPNYAKVIQNALQGDQTAIAALVHRSHSGPVGEAFLGWLEAGQPDHRQLAGELLAEGIRTSRYEQHVMLFLQSFPGHADLRSDRPSGTRDFWAIASCLSGTSVLSFLSQVASDPERKASQRIRAARALPPATSEAAVTSFRAVITAPETDLAERSEAATALAELGPVHSGEAAAVLRAVISDLACSNFDRSNAATRLADLEPGYAEEAAAVLREIIAADQVSPGDRASAADDLAGLGPGYAEEAATALREIIASDQVSPRDRASAADDLAGLGPGYAEEAATALREIIASDQVSPGDRASAAGWLGGLGAGYAEEAAAVLREIIAADQVSPGDRASAADDLAGLGPGYAEEAATALREIIASDQVSPRDRASAADDLAGLGPGYAEEAATALREIAAADQVSPGDRASAAGWLGGLGPGYAGEAAAALREIIASDQAGPGDRASAAGWLGGLGPGYAGEAAAALREIIASDQARPGDRASAAGWLGGLGPGYAGEAAAALREIAASDQARPGDRASAAGWLAELGPGYAEEAATALREIIASDQVSPEERAYAAACLGWLGPGYAEEAATALREIIASDHARPSDRASAARWLGWLGPGYAEEAATALREIIRLLEENQSPWTLAARWLSAHDPDDRDEGSAILREIVSERDSIVDRSIAARWLAEIGPSYSEEGVRLIRELITLRTASSYARASAADDLGSLGDSYADEAATVLHDVMSAPHTSINERVDAAGWLGGLGPAHAKEAGTVLREVISEPPDSAIDRASAARRLGQLSPLHAEEAAAVLREIIDQPLSTALARSFACMCLAEIGPSYRDKTARVIRSIMRLSKNRPADRCLAAALLASVNSGFTGEAISAIRDLIAEPESDEADRVLAAVLLSEIAPGLLGEAERILQDAVSAPGSNSSKRSEIIRKLSRLS